MNIYQSIQMILLLYVYSSVFHVPLCNCFRVIIAKYCGTYDAVFCFTMEQVFYTHEEHVIAFPVKIQHYVEVVPDNIINIHIQICQLLVIWSFICYFPLILLSFNWKILEKIRLKTYLAGTIQPSIENFLKKNSKSIIYVAYHIRWVYPLR